MLAQGAIRHRGGVAELSVRGPALAVEIAVGGEDGAESFLRGVQDGIEPEGTLGGEKPVQLLFFHELQRPSALHPAPGKTNGPNKP